ncbi:hypothetical protein [Niveibacterium umoris]|uniref:hypothetical protein n=1 Tax=Niveibacterium umoris TaxID=1193620 RepID=UPI00161ACFF3|nr:hypothetical protein [Niveibacterium umoris]
MTRAIRLEFSSALYYVFSHGDCRDDIVLSDEDRRMQVQELGDVCFRRSRVCHAWCLMRNPCHQLIETPEDNLSAGCGR